MSCRDAGLESRRESGLISSLELGLALSRLVSGFVEGGWTADGGWAQCPCSTSAGLFSAEGILLRGCAEPLEPHLRWK